MKSKRHKECLIDILYKIIQYPEIEEIYLYGSCVRSQEKYNSDIDLFCCLNIPYKNEYGKLIRQINLTDKPLELPDVDFNYLFNEYKFKDILSFNKSYYKHVYEESELLWTRKNGFTDYFKQIEKEINNGL